MSDFFKKLNVLVKASLNDLLGDDVTGARRRQLTPEKLGKNIQREVVSLRERINEALDYEDTLAGQVEALQREVEVHDQQADDAVAQGREEAARYSIHQMQLAQQRLAMAESDLREHRIVTQELILRVNELEAAVADAQRAQAESEENEAGKAGESVERGTSKLASDVLREMREKIQGMNDLIQAEAEVTTSAEVSDEVEAAVKDDSVDDDLSQRRNRLSKK